MAHFNLRFLEEISDGDQQKLKRLMNAFMIEAPRNFLQLEEACKSRKYDELGKIAHTLKPLYLSIGAEKASSVVKNIEEYSRSAFLRELIPVEIDELGQLNKLIVDEMNTLLNSKL